MIKRSLIFLVLILSIFHTALAAEVLVNGYGLDRQEAINDAYRAAVEKFVDVKLHPKILLDNLEFLYAYVYR